MRRIRLDFMVVPEELEKRAYVPNPVKLVIIDPEAIFLTSILGESGRKLVKSGIPFYFEPVLAGKLVKMGIAKETGDA